MIFPMIFLWYYDISLAENLNLLQREGCTKDSNSFADLKHGWVPRVELISSMHETRQFHAWNSLILHYPFFIGVV